MFPAIHFEPIHIVVDSLQKILLFCFGGQARKLISLTNDFHSINHFYMSLMWKALSTLVTEYTLLCSHKKHLKGSKSLAKNHVK